MYGGRPLEVPSAAELAALATKMAENAGAAYESGKPVFTIVAGRAESSTRLQCEPTRPCRRDLFCRASRTRREHSNRPKLSQNDVDATERERRQAWSGPQWSTSTQVAGGKAAQIPVATLKELPHTPAEGKHSGKLGASMGALIASCPGEFLSLALTCSGAVFTSRDDDPEHPEEAATTLPISSKDLMKGILLHTEADGETPVRGGPLRLTFPWNCAMQPIKGLGDAPVDLSDCVLLQIKP
jgi:hypothetical protein